MEKKIPDKKGKKENKYKAIEEKPTGGGGGVWKAWQKDWVETKNSNLAVAQIKQGSICKKYSILKTSFLLGIK